ncbi:MAG: hypothetical protein JXA20_13735 [Spirochaetes bacterium]|nr:hypothetical protein [Spirochaetota bacterium]
MKRIASIVIFIVIVSIAGHAQEQQSENKSLGLTIKLDYVSNYLWRGTQYFDGDGAFFPTVSYDVLGSGAVVSVIGEFAESWLFEGKKRNFNATGYGNHCLDAGIDYSYTFGESFTLGAGFWYYWMFNSAGADATNRTNYNFLTAKALIRADMLPFTPSLTFYYDYYTAIRRGGDFYITLSLEHRFVLTQEISLGLNLSAGYYYQNTAKSTVYTGTSLTDITYNPMKKGFSDISTLITLNYQKGRYGITGGFSYVVVPAKSWYKGSDVHRFYATFGASLMF